jgi:adenylate cyclase
MRFRYSNNVIGTKIFEQSLDSVCIGRPRPGLHIDLDLTPDTYVSRPHARLLHENGGYWVEDLNSKHGTWVNEQRITEKTRIATDDTVKVGQTTIKLLSEKARLSPDDETHIPTWETAPLSGVQDEDDIVSTKVDASTPPFQSSLSTLNTPSARAKRQLHIFYTFSQALGKATSISEMLRTFVTQVQQALPQAQHGAVLLLDRRGALQLKEHWPLSKPSVSLAWARRACDERAAFLWSREHETDAAPGAISHEVRVAMYAPLIWNQQVLGVVYVDNHNSSDAFRQADLDLLRGFADQLALSLKNQVLVQDVQRDVSTRLHVQRHFSAQVAEQLLRERKHLRFSGEQVEPVTVLHVRVRDLADLSTKIAAASVMLMFNEAVSTITNIIFKYGGAIDTSFGDSVVAVFGSIEPDPQQWERVLQAALEIQQAMRERGVRWKRRGLPLCEMGIGIDTGTVVHGFGGSSERMQYTIIGEAVNRAGRICEAAGQGEIVISDSVYERVLNLVDVVPTMIKATHPDRERDIEAYVVTELREHELGG